MGGEGEEGKALGMGCRGAGNVIVIVVMAKRCSGGGKGGWGF